MSKEEFGEMPKTFKDGEFGFVPSVMLGGPFDGKRYKLPVLPNGAIPDGTGFPMTEPYQTSAYAHYGRVGDEMVGGYYVFIYTETRDANGKQMATEAPEATQQTCEGFSSHYPTTPDETHTLSENS